MKHITILILLFSTVNTSYSQEITGKWYMVNRSGLIEFNITADSLINNYQTTDFIQKEKPSGSRAIERTANLKDRTLIIFKSPHDSGKYAAVVFINIQPGKIMEMAWNVPDTAMPDPEALIAFHSNDNRRLKGYYLYAQPEIRTLKKMRSLESMTLDEFKKYIVTYLEVMKGSEADFSKYSGGYLSAFSHNHQMICGILYRIGFNPLQDIRATGAAFKKYYEDPEIKKLLDGAMSR